MDMGMDVDVDVVDDDDNMLTLYAGVMEALNYRTQLFSSPVDYLEYMRSSGYVAPTLAILSDVNMPILSGYEFMRAVRAVNPDQRFVIVTGSPDVPIQDEFSCFYLTKPFRLAKLADVLRGIAKCNESGAHPDIIKCASIDDRCAFGLEAWRCPRAVEDRKSMK